MYDDLLLLSKFGLLIAAAAAWDWWKQRSIKRGVRTRTLC